MALFRAFCLVVGLLACVVVATEDNKCSAHDRKGKNIGKNLPRGFEPSDLVASGDSLFIVSDEGVLAQTDFYGGVREIWRIEKGKDLEGVCVVPSRPEVVYLGIESPPSVEEYDISEKTLVRKWDVSDYAALAVRQRGLDGEDGIEALAYVSRCDERMLEDGDPCEFIYVGYQRSAVIHVFDLPPKTGDADLNYRGYILPPGPAQDLAALYMWKDDLYANYDKPKTMVAMSLLDPHFVPPPGETLSTDASKDDVPTWVFDRRGQEGVAFGGDYFFVAEDPPEGKGKKTVRRYDADTVDACFKTNDGADATKPWGPGLRGDSGVLEV
mmetsp:Transcript_19536/g.32021  ORF Transcript_19536/g.32021 Transcript_19536/m.32021 type:complete len:326 (+) Transcript_19536:41-1018(+)|eukprot:CAMPEP_0184645898 /NCGR_PEP_ID=MMETSP0308-20130426/2488_1 /TAXON_ID=38269 /ORGANISM="Gloeochaete witrockiana, Strain SAG 46.84" /LENGTH=325 /DNA_ID=CAMNT_0027075383 /DNA_START=22 /DNA_END=999 /DNA_ORIENTATION=-